MKRIIVVLVCLGLLLTGCASTAVLEEKDQTIDSLREELKVISGEKAVLDERLKELELVAIKYDSALIESDVKEETIEKLQEIIEGKEDIIEGLKELNGSGISIGGKAIVLDGEKFESHNMFINEKLMEEKELLFAETKIPSLDTIESLYSNTVETVLIYEIGLIDYSNDYIERNGNKYYKIVDERFQTLNEMARYFSKTFSSREVGSLMTRGFYMEEDDQLYTIGGQAGSLVDQTVLLMTLKDYDLIDKSFTYNVFVKGYSESESVDYYEVSTITIIDEDDEWRVDAYDIAF